MKNHSDEEIIEEINENDLVLADDEEIIEDLNEEDIILSIDKTYNYRSFFK